MVMARKLLFTVIMLLVGAPWVLSVPFADAADHSQSVDLQGRHASYVTIRLPEGARLDNPWLKRASRDISVNGSGRFVGFALVEDGAKPHHVFIGGRLPESTDRRLFVFAANGGFPDSISTRTITIPRGTYRLYILPGDGPAKIRINFSSPVSISSRERAAVDYKQRRMRPLLDSGLDNMHSAGATSEVDSNALLFQASWFENDVHVATNHDACFWRGEPSRPEAYLINCGSTEVTDPGNLWSSQGTTDLRTSSGNDLRMYYGSWILHQSGFRRGAFGQSFDLQSASMIKGLDSLAIWLTLVS